MDEERILENERYQIEQIRQLESEELQVEEVDSDDSDDDVDHSPENGYRGSGGASASGGFTYDTSLAALHSYLGDVEDTHNRLAFLDGGAILKLPMFCLQGVVLFPEATLPLRVIQPHFIAAVERALTQAEAPYTIGVVRLYRDPSDNQRFRFATTGTTAEIRQFRRLEDGSVNVLTRGQQRFRLRRCRIDAEGATCGEVQIIQEDSPLRTPREAVGRLAPLMNLRRGGEWFSGEDWRGTFISETKSSISRPVPVVLVVGLLILLLRFDILFGGDGAIRIFTEAAGCSSSSGVGLPACNVGIAIGATATA